ncbi:hypothetical protein [Haliscomenobacter sp.]|uniref:hypothetical protein n=1 Tax=Haliscomenobacter sp. TaxID=2717303 RepID=UPI0033652CCE
MNLSEVMPPKSAKRVHPGEFEAHRHWYPKALNATIHPMVNFFLNLSRERMISRYCHLHPVVKADALAELLDYKCKYFLWAGADLLNVTSASARRQMVIIENNSCPSGQKSMPLTDDHQEQGGYRLLIERTFKPFLQKKTPGLHGALAVLYDKNHMEASGYAAVIADVMKEDVFFVPFFSEDPDMPVRFNQDAQMEVRDEANEWHLIRAAFRYVTQRPWYSVPLHTKTRIFNPVVACLAGGRNKMMAAKAYELFNEEWEDKGLRINTPQTVWDVSKEDIPKKVAEMGGQAVVKVPYSNAGQGVYTIVTEAELAKFMAEDFKYDCFIVQSLIGNYNWSSTTSSGKLYHVGTIPTANGKTYVADLRMMVSSTETGILPICAYARRARKPLEDQIEDGSQSWDMLGTNLSIKNPDGTWDSDTSRLVLMDRRDFNKLGIGLDDLIEAYIQTVLSTVAIDKMAQTLVNSQGKFRMKLFKSINNDPSLIEEITL